MLLQETLATLWKDQRPFDRPAAALPGQAFMRVWACNTPNLTAAQRCDSKILAAFIQETATTSLTAVQHEAREEPAGFSYQRSHRRLSRSQTEPLDLTSLNKSSYRPISLDTATQPQAPSDRRALSTPSTCQCDTKEMRLGPTSDHDGPSRQAPLDPADHALPTEPGTSEATYFAPITGEALANQRKFVEAVTRRF